MKTIAKFKIKENFSNKFNYVEVIYIKEQNCYALTYKYISMDKESIRMYNNIDMAMYDFNRKVMFLLS